MSQEVILRPFGMDIIETPNAAVSHPQQELIKFVEAKLAVVREDLAEAEANIAAFKEKKWKHQPFVSLAAKAKAQVEYYEKVLAALSAGYVIMPPINCEVFAVRCSSDSCLPSSVTQKDPPKWAKPSRQLEQVETNSPALGDGEYVAPEVMFESSDDTAIGSNGKDVVTRVIDATQAAMALKVFDDIVISPSRTGRKKDPIIAGRIHRKHRKFSEPLYFLIAWLVRSEDI